MGTTPAFLVLEDSDVAFGALARYLTLEDYGFKVFRQRRALKAAGVWARLQKNVDVKAILLDVFTEDVIGRAGTDVFINAFPIQDYPTLLWTAELDAAVELLTRAGRKAIIVTADPKQFSGVVARSKNVAAVHYSTVNFKKPLKEGWFYICSKEETDTVVIKFLRDATA